jgi:hypothetical protein
VREIRGDAKSIRSLLCGAKFAIDYYQREYRWESKQVAVPKSFNASYGDKPYAEKREHYFGQNLLAQSLHETAYDHNPGFRNFREESGLSFKAHAEFNKADLDARQELYRAIAEQIWSPDVLRREVET